MLDEIGPDRQDRRSHSSSVGRDAARRTSCRCPVVRKEWLVPYVRWRSPNSSVAGTTVMSRRRILRSCTPPTFHTVVPQIQRLYPPPPALTLWRIPDRVRQD